METSARKDIYKELQGAPRLDFFYLEGTLDSPEVLLDKVGGLIKLAGRSLPEDAKNFYKPIMDWIVSYFESAPTNTRVIFQFEYINSSSSKMILEFLDLIKHVFENKKENHLYVEWRYLDDDDDMLEAGEDFEERAGISFNFVKYSL